MVFRDREIDVHHRVVRDGGQRLRKRSAYQRARTVGNRAGHAVRRGLHYRIGEVVGRVHALCLGLCQLRLGGEQVVLGRREVVPRDYLLGEQLLLAVVGELCGGHAGLGCGHVGFGRLESRLIGNLVDDKEGLALRYGLSFVEADLRDRAGNLRIDRNVLTSVDLGRVVARDRAVGGGDGHYGVLTGPHFRRGLFARDGCHAACHEGSFHKCLSHNSSL